ncbi:MAG: Acyl-phosphate:glycerol-3-phosphate O-acyltransferase PlsY (EC, partial [uncultured Solirubrobacteraceae bacterium]
GGLRARFDPRRADRGAPSRRRSPLHRRRQPGRLERARAARWAPRVARVHRRRAEGIARRGRRPRRRRRLDRVRRRRRRDGRARVPALRGVPRRQGGDDVRRRRVRGRAVRRPHRARALRRRHRGEPLRVRRAGRRLRVPARAARAVPGRGGRGDRRADVRHRRAVRRQDAEKPRRGRGFRGV